MSADPAVVQALLAALEVATAEDDESDSAGIAASPTEKLLLTFPEAGDFLGLSRSWVFRAVRTGLLPSVEIPGARGRYIRRRDLEQFVEVLRVSEAAEDHSGQLRAAAGGSAVISLDRRPKSRGSAPSGSSSSRRSSAGRPR